MQNDETSDDELINVIVDEDDIQKFKRLDHYLVQKISSKSRSFIKSLFENSLIQSTHTLSLKKMPPAGTQITIDFPPPIPSQAEAENIPLDVLYEDEHLIAINKKAGMVIHPAPGNYTGTLVNALLYHCKDLTGVGNVIRPGIVHRLDKGTTGVMIAAKTQLAHEKLVLTFSQDKLTRTYEAIAVGRIEKEQGTLKATIGRDPGNRLRMKARVAQGKKSITHFRLLSEKENLLHLEFTLETGRTHQIRAHAKDLLFTPLLNDPLYANINQQKQRIDESLHSFLDHYEHPFLHAKLLHIHHPISGELLKFEASAPSPMKEVIQWIQSPN